MGNSEIKTGRRSIAVFSSNEMLWRFFELEAMNCEISVECFSDISVNAESYDAVVVDIDTVKDSLDFPCDYIAYVSENPLSKKKYATQAANVYYFQWPSDLRAIRAFYDSIHTVDIKSRKETESDKEIIYYSDANKNTVWYRNKRIEMSESEMKLLCVLCEADGKVVSRDAIECIFESQKGNIADVYIHYLRKKLEEPFSHKLIYSVRGQGYRTVARLKKHKY